MSFEVNREGDAQEAARKEVEEMVRSVGGELRSRQAIAILEFLVGQIELLRDEIDQLREDAGL